MDRLYCSQRFCSDLSENNATSIPENVCTREHDAVIYIIHSVAKEFWEIILCHALVPNPRGSVSATSGFKQVVRSFSVIRAHANFGFAQNTEQIRRFGMLLIKIPNLQES